MTLEDLSIRALHRLDAANSRLRHSVVEACFYNLRLLAQELPDRRGNGDFAKNLDEALANASNARKLIDAHLAYEAKRGVTVAGLFPQEREAVMRALGDIERLAAAGVPERNNVEASRAFGDRIVADVDDALSAIDRMRAAVAGRRIPIWPVLEELVSMHRPACEAQDVELELHGDGVRHEVFAQREPLLNALSELVKNALRHACSAGQDGGNRIAVRLGTDESTHDTVISVADNGRGIPPERLALIGSAGASTSGGGDGIAMVRRIIEGEQFGLVTFESEPGKGTTVRVRLPRRAEPGLEPAAEKADSDVDVAAGAARRPRLSARRILAAAIAFFSILAVGFLLAWLAVLM